MANARPHRVTVDLPAPINDALDALTTRSGRSRNSYIVQALEQMLFRRAVDEPPPSAAICSQCGKHALVAGYTAPDLKPLCDDCF